MVILFIGYLSMGIGFVSFLTLLINVYTYLKGFVIVENLTPYVITSFFILLLSIITAAIGQDPLDKPYRGITKVFSKYGIPYWIIAINHLYIYVYSLFLLMFGNWQVEDTYIMGLKFNYIIANALMLLSFISLLILVVRVRNKFTD